MIYLKFFGLEVKPFHTTPDPHFLYLSPSHKQALGSIIYGIKEQKGFISVTGQVGLGKTTILRSFLAQTDQANQQTIYLLNPNLSFTYIVKTLLDELGHDPIDGDDAELVEQLQLVLIEEYQQGRTVVLLIDEAQNMPIATLEHLRMLSNLETPKDKLIQIVLLGQPELDALLDRYELRQLRQRIAVRAVIQPLSQKESVEYIEHRLDKAGGQGKKIFTNSALGLIAREAKGIPRRLNILCDNALVTAFGYKKSPVTASIAKEVIGDLAGRPPQSLWKLVPMAAGAFILLLALVSLMRLTNDQFADTAPLDETGQLVALGDTPNQDLLNEEMDINVPDQGGLTLVERAQTWLTESVEEVWEEWRELPIPESDPQTLPPNLEVATALENQEDVVLAKKVIRDVKDSVPGVSTEPKDLEVLETATDNTQTDQKHVPEFSELGDPIVVEEEQPFPVEETLLVQDESGPSTYSSKDLKVVYPNPETLKNHSAPSIENVAEEQERQPQKDIVAMPKKTRPLQKLPIDPVEETLLVQEKSELSTDFSTGLDAVNPPSENLDKPSAQTVENVAGEQKRQPQKDNPPAVSTAKKTAPLKKLPRKKSEVVAATLPITKIMKKGDTLAGLMKEVYGSASPSTLRVVLDHNRHIVNVRKIYPGQQIEFPPLSKKGNKKKSKDIVPALVSHKGKKVRSTKKIFTGSSEGPKPNLKKNGPKRPSPYAMAIVREGDTLEELAKIVYGSADPTYIERVLAYNPQIRNPKKIFPGQNIAFPKIDKPESTNAKKKDSSAN